MDIKAVPGVVLASMVHMTWFHWPAVNWALYKGVAPLLMSLANSIEPAGIPSPFPDPARTIPFATPNPFVPPMFTRTSSSAALTSLGYIQKPKATTDCPLTAVATCEEFIMPSPLTVTE